MNQYKEGNTIKGKVTGVEDYGIFVSVDEETDGLIHISEISDAFVKNVHDYAEVGQTIEAKVIEYDAENKKLKLSIKELNEEVKKKKREKIKETEHGFETLKKELTHWIEEKEKELE